MELVVGAIVGGHYFALIDAKLFVDERQTLITPAHDLTAVGHAMTIDAPSVVEGAGSNTAALLISFEEFDVTW